MMMPDLEALQQAVQSLGAEAWILYDFRGINSLAHTILGVPSNAHCTRRWMVVIPHTGDPVKVVHRMERDHLAHLPWIECVYSTHEEWTSIVAKTIAPYHTVAMEYSPNNVIPVVSKVDAGTVEFVRGLGHDVISSGNISQMFTSILTEAQLAGAISAAHVLRRIILSAFALIRERLRSNATINEYDVQQFILQSFADNNMVTDSVPIVAIGSNASMPHYAPSEQQNSDIQRDMVVLIDSWAKYDTENAVFADLTWVGYTGTVVPRDIAEKFDVIVRARDAAVELVHNRFSANQPLRGFEVDDECRSVVANAGLSAQFIHRTGHNITTEIHGPGVNMDNFETHDERQILPGMSFSIEPGVYQAGVLGLRTEIDVIVAHDNTIHIPSSPMQQSILPLLNEVWEH